MIVWLIVGHWSIHHCLTNCHTLIYLSMFDLFSHIDLLHNVRLMVVHWSFVFHTWTNLRKVHKLTTIFYSWPSSSSKSNTLLWLLTKWFLSSTPVSTVILTPSQSTRFSNGRLTSSHILRPTSQTCWQQLIRRVLSARTLRLSWRTLSPLSPRASSKSIAKIKSWSFPRYSFVP